MAVFIVGTTIMPSRGLMGLSRISTNKHVMRIKKETKDTDHHTPLIHTQKNTHIIVTFNCSL